MEEYKFQLVITPETYDYNEEEIVYRIYFDKQLISERSIPILKNTQAMTENFVLKIENSSEIKIFQFQNIKTKKAFIEKIIINGFFICNNKNDQKIRIQGLHMNLRQHINNSEERSNEL